MPLSLPALKVASDGRQSRRQLVACYAGAHFGKSLFWYASESLFAFFSTEIAHLSPLTMGLMLAASFLLSGLADVIIGRSLKIRLTTAWSAGRVQLAGMCATTVCFVILLSTPAVGAPFTLISAVISVMLFRLAYAFVDIPQNALLSLAPSDSQARVSMASARLAASGVAALIVAGAVSSLVYGSATEQPVRLTVMAAVAVVLGLGTSWTLSRFLDRRAINDNRRAPISPADGGHRLPRQTLLLLVVMALTSLASPIFTKLMPYYAAFHVGDALEGSVTIGLVSAGMILGQPAWLALLRHRSAFARIAVTALATSGSAALFGAAGLGVPFLLLPAALLFGASTGGLGTALWAAYGDTVAAVGHGSEGLAYGLLTASAKLALAIGIVGIGILLSDPSFRDASSETILAGMTVPPFLAGLLIAALVKRREIVHRNAGMK